MTPSIAKVSGEDSSSQGEQQHGQCTCPSQAGARQNPVLMKERETETDRTLIAVVTSI